MPTVLSAPLGPGGTTVQDADLARTGAVLIDAPPGGVPVVYTLEAVEVFGVWTETLRVYDREGADLGSLVPSAGPVGGRPRARLDLDPADVIRFPLSVVPATTQSVTVRLVGRAFVASSAR